MDDPGEEIEEKESAEAVEGAEQKSEAEDGMAWEQEVQQGQMASEGQGTTKQLWAEGQVVGIKAPGGDWVLVRDTDHGIWGEDGWHMRECTSIAKSLLKSLVMDYDENESSWPVRLKVGTWEWVEMVEQHDEDSPSVRLGTVA